MNDDFFNFLREPTRENMLYSQNQVASNSKYNPYSDYLSVMSDLFDKEEYQKILDDRDINTLLSPRAHFYKLKAAKKLNLSKLAETETFFLQGIIEAICNTGDGSKLNPYSVLAVQDERDILTSLGERLKSQHLIEKNGKYYDLISCESGRQIYFDITKPYSKLQELLNSELSNEPTHDESKPKKWWKFWK